IHAASGLTSVIGEAGLHYYKCGRSVTMMADPQSGICVYNVIHDNLLVGNHTLMLTEYAEQVSGEPSFLDPADALKTLLSVENDLKYGILSLDTFAIVASRIGGKEKSIVSGKIRSLVELKFGPGPHSIIITGRLHSVEEDSLAYLTNNLDNP